MIAHLLNEIEEPLRKTAQKLKDSFYVDNCITSVDSQRELEEFISQPREILESAQFDLRGWQYNLNTDESSNEKNFEKEESAEAVLFRAVHLELITSLSTENFLQALRRFVARRGRPHIIYSDNGTNFVAANKGLNSVDWQDIQNYAAVRKIEWKFNPPAAPWWGGFWERLIRILKSILKRILGKACLEYEELNTILCDTESIINTRPLTYISEDPTDLVTLTPEMFLQDIRETGVPDLDNIDQTKMKKRFAYRQKLREDLRRRFRNEYLGYLREFSKNIAIKNPIKEGDIVLINDDKLKRIHWPLAKVEKIYPGRDGHFRVAKLKTKNGELIRPYQRLCPLELDIDETQLVVKKSRYGRTIRPTQRLNVTSEVEY